MPYFKRNSLAVLSFLLLSFSLKAQPQPFLSLAEDGLVFNAGFQYKEHYFSGILVVKSVDEGQQIVMLSKMGPTIMDFIMHSSGAVTWNKKVEEINKPIFEKAIVKDFRTLLLTPLYDPKKVKALAKSNFKVKKHEKLMLQLKDDRVISSENRGVINLFKTFVKYAYIDEDAIPDEICLTHRNLKLKIELTQMSNE